MGSPMSRDEQATTRVAKRLAANDLGLTGSHQSGIHVPKQADIQAFFPRLDSSRLNPSRLIDCYSPELDEHLQFRYIHYNNKLVSGGTRNEYRLTRMTDALRRLGAHVGATIVFTKDRFGEISIEIIIAGAREAPGSGLKDVYLLEGGWTITIKQGDRNG